MFLESVNLSASFFCMYPVTDVYITLHLVIFQQRWHIEAKISRKELIDPLKALKGTKHFLKHFGQLGKKSL